MNILQNNKSFIVYKASAGSGKTYNLAKAYLLICFSHIDNDPFVYRKILAITFTNKAVNEMKSRILLFLQKLSDGSDKALMDDFSKEYSKEEIRRYASTLLKRINHDYSNFSIFTIDSFFQQIVRAFSYDLYLPSNHQLELDINILIKKAVDLVLAKLGHDSLLTDFMVQYAYNQIDSNKNWQIDKNLRQIAKEIYRDEAVPALKKLENLEIEDFKEIIKKLYEIIVVVDNQLKTIASHAVALIKQHNIAFDAFFQGNKGIGQWFKNMETLGMEKIIPNSFVTRTILENKWTAASTDSVLKNNISAISSQLEIYYKEIQLFKEKYYTKFQICKAVKDYIYPTALLNEIKKAVNQIKIDDKTLHISEINHLISCIVQQESIPFIYERLGDKYKYFFIDEFQDTSVLQWQNILPLFCEGLSSEVYVGETGKAAIFGDAKQAIYRFREGDVRQFIRLPNVNGSNSTPIIKEREEVLVSNYHKEDLNKNFRSKEEIVSFNNEFFTYVTHTKPDDSYSKTMYADLIQSWKENHGGGGVSLIKLTENKLNKEARYEFILKETREIINQVLRDGYRLSDMAILCRKNDLASYLAQEISSLGFDVISSESLLLNQSLEVRFLLACFSYIVNPSDELARAFILQYLVKQTNKHAEDVLTSVKDESLFLQTIFELGYSFNPHTLKFYNSYEMVEQLCQVFDLNKQNNPFILSFSGVVFDYVQSESTKYADFLEYWEERGAKISLSNPEGIHAIRLLTIHKSKGLQFPVVIYPQVVLQNNHPATQWINLNPNEFPFELAHIKVDKSLKDTDWEYLLKEEEKLKELDELNLDYVAYTRAEDRLYIIDTDKDESLINFFNSKNIQNESVDSQKLIYKYGSFARNEHENSQTIENVCIEINPMSELHLPTVIADRKFVSNEMRWGTLLHAYLSLLYKMEDIDYVAEIIHNEAMFSHKEKELTLQVLSQFSTESYKKLLFGESDARIKTEVELMDTEGNLFRIDRLIVKNENCLVIDFKTGGKESAHKKQILHYADLLKEIGFKNVDSYLVYISNEGELSFEKIYENN